MSIFPTRILLATDGSENVAHATNVAAQLSNETGSELHVLYVGEDAYSATLVYPEATDPGGVRWDDPVLVGQLQRQFERMSRRVLDTEVEKVREAGGGGRPGAPEDGQAGRGDSRPGGGAGRRAGGGGQPGVGRGQEGLDGKRLRFGGPPRPLPRPGRAQRRRIVGGVAGTPGEHGPLAPTYALACGDGLGWGYQPPYGALGDVKARATAYALGHERHVYPSDLSDAEWEFPQRHLPPIRTRGRVGVGVPLSVLPPPAPGPRAPRGGRRGPGRWDTPTSARL